LQFFFHDFFGVAVDGPFIDEFTAVFACIDLFVFFRLNSFYDNPHIARGMARKRGEKERCRHYNAKTQKEYIFECSFDNHV